MTRKNLNDVIHGDRALVRGYRAQLAKFDDWKYGQDAEPYDASRTATTYYSGSKTSAPSCYHSHPALKLPGTELVIYGGSCHHPVVTDADVYIGFDAGMMVSERNRPWNPGGEVTHVLFKISDMSVPTEAKEFVKLVDWTKASWKPARRCTAAALAAMGAPACSSRPWSPASASRRHRVRAQELLQEGGREPLSGRVPGQVFRRQAGVGAQGLRRWLQLDQEDERLDQQVEGADRGQGDVLPDRQQRLHLGVSAGGLTASNCTNFLAMTRHCAIVISGNRVHGG